MICAFCGYDGGVPKDAEDAMRQMSEPVVDCEKHPLHSAAKMLEEKDAQLAAAQDKVCVLEQTLVDHDGVYDSNVVTVGMVSHWKAIEKAARVCDKDAIFCLDNAAIPDGYYMTSAAHGRALRTALEAGK